MPEDGKLLRKGNQASSGLCKHVCFGGPGLGGANFVVGEVVYALRQAQCLLGISTRFLGCTLADSQGKQTPSIRETGKEPCIYRMSNSRM